VLARDGDIAELVRERVPEGVDALLDVVNYAPGTYDAALKPGARVGRRLSGLRRCRNRPSRPRSVAPGGSARWTRKMREDVCRVWSARSLSGR
jgi:hypothetical protein